MDDWPTLSTFGRFGRRRAALCLFGILWVAVGISVLTTARARFTPIDDPTILSLMDRREWGWMWMVCAAVAIFCGLFRNRYRALDEWGFNALLIPPMVWMLAYVWAEIAWLATAGQIGRSNGWIGAVIYTVISLAILMIAGWPDPADEVRKEAK